MDLVVHQVDKLHHIHGPHCNGAPHGFSCSSVVKEHPSVGGQFRGTLLAGLLHQVKDLLLGRSLEHCRGNMPAVPGGHEAEDSLQDLAEVHPARDTDRVQDHVDGGSVRQVGHVLLGKDPGDDTLVAVSSGHLVADGYLPDLGHVYLDHLVDAGGKLIAVLGAAELFDGDHLAALTVGDPHRGVPDLPGLLAKDGPQQFFLGGLVGLTLGGDLTHKDISGHDLGADPYDPRLVEVLEGILADVGDVAGYLLRPQLGIPGLYLVLLDMNGREAVVLHQPVA